MADQEKNEQTQMSLDENAEKVERNEKVAEPVVSETASGVSSFQEKTTETVSEMSQEPVQEVKPEEIKSVEESNMNYEPIIENVQSEELLTQTNPTIQQQAQVDPGMQKGGPIPGFMQTAGNQPKVTGEEKIWAMVSYIPLVAVMSLVLQPKSEYIKLHGRQGLLIFLIFFFSIFVYLVPYIGPVIGIFVHIACIGIGILSMYQAFIGNWWKIPVLGDIAELIPVEMFVKVTRSAVMGPAEAKMQEQQDEKNKEAAASDSNSSEKT